MQVEGPSKMTHTHVYITLWCYNRNIRTLVPSINLVTMTTSGILVSQSIWQKSFNVAEVGPANEGKRIHAAIIFIHTYLHKYMKNSAGYYDWYVYICSIICSFITEWGWEYIHNLGNLNIFREIEAQEHALEYLWNNEHNNIWWSD